MASEVPEAAPAVEMPDDSIDDLDPDDPFAGGVLPGSEIQSVAGELDGPSRVAAPIYAEPIEVAPTDPPPPTDVAAPPTPPG